MDCHECQGFSCPFVTQTRDGYVCMQSGICLNESIMMLNQDPNDGMQILSKGKDKNVSNFVEVVVSDHDKTGYKMDLVARKHVGQKDSEKTYYVISHICHETVRKLLKSPCREQVSQRMKDKAFQTALKTMTLYTKKCRERGVDFSLSFASLIGLSVYKTKAGRYDSKTPSDEFVHHVANRVTKLCIHFSFDDRSKQTKFQYKSLAFLYLLKNDVYHKGVVVARKERSLGKMLPDLSELDLFGYEKNKWTEAMKSVSFAQCLVPLQSI